MRYTKPRILALALVRLNREDQELDQAWYELIGSGDNTNMNRLGMARSEVIQTRKGLMS